MSLGKRYEVYLPITYNPDERGNRVPIEKEKFRQTYRELWRFFGGVTVMPESENQALRGFWSDEVGELFEDKVITVLGEDSSSLLGALLLSQIELATLSRSDIQEGERRDFYLFVDEFSNFATPSFIGMLSEARKYGLNLTICNQFISQLAEEMRAAVFGNVGTLISFQVGADDAEYLAKEFAPVFSEEDLINLPRYHIYLKLMCDGKTSGPFSAVTLPPPDTFSVDFT